MGVERCPGEVICGLKGNDAINGRGGNDTLNTRDRVRRNDLANGGEGADACAVDRGDRKSSCR